ncbi:MAG: hypothetical protein JWQ83_258 [Lacunisphaera sp.]|nr:hypothetical protein [Lacunisphaera sp.]
MNSRKPRRYSARGSALITVVFLMFMMALLTGSILLYSGGENRANNRNRLILRANNAAENIALYASEQITAKLYRQRNQNPRAFMNHVAGVHDQNEVVLPPTAVLTTQFTDGTGMEVRAGLTTSNPVAYIDPTNAANAGNPNAGLSAATQTVQIIAKATATHPVLGSITRYCEQDLEVATIPLYQFAVFYNMDMEFGPGADMTISGPVHTNGNLIARDQSNKTNTLEFQDRVTSAKGFFANTGYKGSTIMNDGSSDTGPGGTGHLYFTAPSGTKTDINNGAIWRDHFYGVSYTSPATATTAPPASSLTSFKTFATNTYGNNLRTSVHGVTPLVLPAISNYNETDDPATAEDDRDNGRQIIEAPDSTDTAGMCDTKISRNAGLYIIVNPTAQTRTGVLPDASTVPMRAYSYRCWLNTINSDLTHTITEVILPGQPSYGALNAYVNNLPNAYREDTAVGSNQVLRIPKGGGVDLADTGYSHSAAPTYTSFDDAYFYDLRRATNPYPVARSGGTPFTPRPITKIDFDMTRFKMTVDRTYSGNTSSTVYYPSLPSNAATWNNFIFNSAATTGSYGLGVAPGSNAAFTLFPGSDIAPVIQRGPTGTFSPASITIAGSTQNGVAVATSYSSRFTVETTTNAPSAAGAYTGWTAVGTAPLDGSADIPTSTTYTPSGATITAIRITQYLGGAAWTAARQIDQQVIPVVDSTVAVNSTLTNDYCLIPSSASGATPNYFPNALTDMRVYVNGADDTANWAFTLFAAPSGGVSGYLGGNATGTGIQTGSGPFKNRYIVTAMSGTTTGSVTIQATRAGYTTQTRTFTLVKQSNIAAAASPAGTGYWLGASTLPGPDPFQIYFAPLTATDRANVSISPSSLAVSASYLYNSFSPCPWRDGISVYILSVNAEDRSLTAGALNRADSGVRLWNGRGPATSLPSSTGLTGFALATNDPVYIVGNFNADGSLNTTITSTTNPGGYSPVYPDSSSEYLTSIMGDAITLLSQPNFSSGASGAAPYLQTDGWADSLSSHVGGATASSASWQTSAPSGSNPVDGINTSQKAGDMPNLSIPSTNAFVLSNNTNKLPALDTEVSACLLIGIVPTNANPSAASATGTYVTNGAPSSGPNGQTSGGVHNYPRLQEVWTTSAGTSAKLVIRGSLVAMFESRVAMEPWSIRWYNAPTRMWGMNANLGAAGGTHHVPLEPLMLNARRMRFMELTAAQYGATKTVIEALAH